MNSQSVLLPQSINEGLRNIGQSDQKLRCPCEIICTSLELTSRPNSFRKWHRQHDRFILQAGRKRNEDAASKAFSAKIPSVSLERKKHGYHDKKHSNRLR